MLHDPLNKYCNSILYIVFFKKKKKKKKCDYISFLELDLKKNEEETSGAEIYHEYLYL
jgi:hypothetical protein